MEIKVDDLSGGEVISLLEEHLADMYKVSPAESVHALNIDALKASNITFFSSWEKSCLMGCVAINKLNSQQVELKSMRTSREARKSGVATKLLQHVIKVCCSQGIEQIYLETGSQNYFKPAHSLYEKFGFSYCGPFANYQLDPCSKFMTLILY